jgi:ankyrin repeat protein
MKTEELIEAVKAGDEAKVGALLDEDRGLLTAKAGETSAILLALYHGKAGIARLFTDRGAELTFPEAVAVGDEGRVRALLAKDPSLVKSYSADGYPAAGLAIFFCHPALARQLIDAGADINAAARNAQKVAPIHAAAAVRDLDTMRLLLERGANPDARQQEGFTAMHSAGLHGNIEMAKLLIEHGADPNVKTDDGKTAADMAREKNQQVFVEWLATV